MAMIPPRVYLSVPLFELVLLCAAAPPPHAERAPVNIGAEGVMAQSEELIYEVSWTLFKLGTIRIKTFPNYTAEARIDSYDGLPFVKLHSVHYCAMDSNFFSRGSRSVDKKDNEWRELDYVFDRLHKAMTVEECFRKELQSAPYRRTVLDTLHLKSDSVVDGLSIAYFPRSLVHTKQTVDIPTVLYGKLGVTTYRMTGKKTEVEIDALDHPVRVVEMEGSTTAQGLYGMTGEFTGWFSDDAAAVPIKGKLQVLIGSVTVELIGWHRQGWTPPQ